MNDDQFAISDLRLANENPSDAGDIVRSQIDIRKSQIAPAAITSSHPITIRAATLADLPFIDSLQKKHSRELGFLPTKALEGKIGLGQVLVAEATGVASSEWLVASEHGTRGISSHSPLATRHSVPAGYLIAADRYFKRDEIGYITQMCVVPEYRRSLVAGMLLQAQFDRSAYGCKLYCCWCAQDLAANAFWEAMGFTAIAFRTGSMKRGSVGGVRGSAKTSLDSTPNPGTRTLNPRVHIFWQKRIRANDTTTPWWYPSTTGAGEIREDRLVFPIMPGVRWQDVKAIALPATEGSANCDLRIANEQPEPARVKPRIANRKSKIAKVPQPKSVGAHVRSGLRFGPAVPVVEAVVEKQAPVKQPKQRVKIDPRLMAMSRELRDKWAEQVAPALEAIEAKHDVRKIAHGSVGDEPVKLIAA